MTAFYLLGPDGQTISGPFLLADCFALIDNGIIEPGHMVCREGTEAWQIAGMTPELALHFRRKPPESLARGSTDMALIVLASLVIPLIGMIFGAMDICTAERRSGGVALLFWSLIATWLDYWLIIQFQLWPRHAF